MYIERFSNCKCVTYTHLISAIQTQTFSKFEVQFAQTMTRISRRQNTMNKLQLCVPQLLLKTIILRGCGGKNTVNVLPYIDSNLYLKPLYRGKIQLN